MTDEPRYTIDELLDIYFSFLKHPETQARLKRDKIRTWHHEELLIRFLAFVRNVAFIEVKREVEWRKVEQYETLYQFLKRSIEKTAQLSEKPEKAPPAKPPKDLMFGEPTKGDLFQ